ncbi:MAG: 4Fe-4S single cluster domain-containing protein [Mariniblastus sp.]
MSIPLSNLSNIQVAQIVPVTQAEGPGTRFALWVQGCPLRCPGCCNPEMLAFKGGTSTTVQDVVTQVENAMVDADGNPQIEGLTFLGGEPFSHAEGLAEVATRVQALGLSVMIFSGFTIESLKEKSDPHVDQLLTHTDILVDGPYYKDQPDPSRRWIGSANQRIHFLSDRYGENDARWDRSDTLEIRLNGNELTVNGFPAVSAVGLWKRPKKQR